MRSQRGIANEATALGVLAAAALLLGGVACPPRALADTSATAPALASNLATSGLLDAEYAVFGEAASAAYVDSDPGGEVGGVQQGQPGAHANLGRKVKAGLLSLILPGAGQYYNGDRGKAYLFAGAEAAVWASYLTFDRMGDNRTESYKQYAGAFAGAHGGSDDYWQAVGRYPDSDAYNESLLREARAFQTPPSGLVGAANAWQWNDPNNQRTYQDLRADATRLYSRRDFMVLFAVINRVVAVYDAVRNSVNDKLNQDILGFHVQMKVTPSLRHPATGCVISRKF